MYYETKITIPRNTSRYDPVKVVLPVHPGIVKQVGVFFPDGCSGLAEITISLWGHQLWPANPDGAMRGNNSEIVFPEDFELVDPPFEFIITGWNSDDTYQHEPIIRIQVTPKSDTINQLLGLLSLGPTGDFTSQG
jgi:hypothetical protein